jgi:imidazolonepropionase-like amidohydrolase
MSLVISGATIIDGTGAAPLEGCDIIVQGDRIAHVGRPENSRAADGNAQTIDARGKYAIPGLMNANVHLSFGIYSVERLARHLSYYSDDTEAVVLEAAQVALKNGLTTVFDTCGLRRPLMAVRDKINSKSANGSRIYCAGWIVGFDGLFSEDFIAKAKDILTPTYVRRVNAMCVENVGRHLMWLTPAQVAEEVRSYIAKGIDFLKYASNEHVWASAGAFLTFSPKVQEAIVGEAHRAMVTAQAHTMSVEGLRVAVEAGSDLIQHANITGPVPIPDTTLELMAKNGTGAVVFPLAERVLEWVLEHGHEQGRSMWQASDINTRNLIRSGAPLLLGNDGTVIPTEVIADKRSSKGWAAAPDEKNIAPLGGGHFAWLEAMEEKGCPAMEMLKAATTNIAVAYRKDRDLGTLEVGKVADILILEANPLLAARNYRTIAAVIKDGLVIERGVLPTQPVLTKSVELPAPEEASYVPANRRPIALPFCPMCSTTSTL